MWVENREGRTHCQLSDVGKKCFPLLLAVVSPWCEYFRFRICQICLPWTLPRLYRPCRPPRPLALVRQQTLALSNLLLWIWGTNFYGHASHINESFPFFCPILDPCKMLPKCLANGHVVVPWWGEVFAVNGSEWNQSCCQAKQVVWKLLSVEIVDRNGNGVKWG